MGSGAGSIALAMEVGRNFTERRLDENQAVANLVRRCVAGDAAAWEEIVRQYNRRIYNLCYRFAGSTDDAQDLTQEVFIKIYRTLPSFDSGKAAFITWVTTVTRNLLVDHFRKGKYDRMTDSLDAPIGEEEDGLAIGSQLADKGQTPDEKLESRETKEMVHRGLQKLALPSGPSASVAGPTSPPCSRAFGVGIRRHSSTIHPTSPRASPIRPLLCAREDRSARQVGWSQAA